MNPPPSRFDARLQQALFWLYFLAAIGISLHSLRRGPSLYNNFRIFQAAFHNLLNHVNLYELHPEQYDDWYLYSPPFAVCMGIFSLLPNALGLCLWNLLNTLAVYFGVQGLPLDSRKKSTILLLVIFSLWGSVQNSQSNGLVAGLMLIAFNQLESGRAVRAALAISLGCFVKLFPIVMAPLFLYSPKKWRFLFAMAGWCGLLLTLPIWFVGVESTLQQYRNWLNLLAHDDPTLMNYSFMALVERVSGVPQSNGVFLAFGTVLLLLPFLKRPLYHDQRLRMMHFASLLIWVVIFNRHAESPSYVIALCGAALWFVVQKPSVVSIGLMAFVIGLTCLAVSDLSPDAFQEHYMMRYALQALPCVVLWFFIEFQLLTARSSVASLPERESIGV